ncbi:hypothetical protein [Caballeronia sp. LZ019]|uniref:hypothetical protein n=1 Tax=Caballeronia sp. LZ019 TaxID=3038555 RepID=UPI00285DC8CE|nr:hypothetical protein [Caballeronia sp. LZ019]MDR5809074.1 hypothetical protein [Caballeronia sp. LZ019]
MTSHLSNDRLLVVVLGSDCCAGYGPTGSDARTSGQSAEYFRNYALSKDGLDVGEDRLLWLFNSPFSSTLMIELIHEFAEKHRQEASEGSPLQLLFYYSGFAGFDQQSAGAVFLGVHSTSAIHPSGSSLSIGALRKATQACGPSERIHIIIDAVLLMQHAEAERMPTVPTSLVDQFLQEPMTRPTTVFVSLSTGAPCASGAAPPTYFAQALSDALTRGVANRSSHLSINEVARLVRIEYEQTSASSDVRTLLTTAEADSLIALFPNAARSGFCNVETDESAATESVRLFKDYRNREIEWPEIPVPVRLLLDERNAVSQGDLWLAGLHFRTKQVGMYVTFALCLLFFLGPVAIVWDLIKDFACVSGFITSSVIALGALFAACSIDGAMLNIRILRRGGRLLRPPSIRSINEFSPEWEELLLVNALRIPAVLISHEGALYTLRAVRLQILIYLVLVLAFGTVCVLGAWTLALHMINASHCAR